MYLLFHLLFVTFLSNISRILKVSFIFRNTLKFPSTNKSKKMLNMLLNCDIFSKTASAHFDSFDIYFSLKISPLFSSILVSFWHWSKRNYIIALWKQKKLSQNFSVCLMFPFRSVETIFYASALYVFFANTVFLLLISQLLIWRKTIPLFCLLV